MKRLLNSLLVGFALFASSACADIFREEIYDIHAEIDKINARLDELCQELNENVSSLQTIIDAILQNDFVKEINPVKKDGVVIGYDIIFTQSGKVTIYHGEKGETGDDGHSPQIGMKQDTDGRWYWTIDGEWMLDANNNKVLAVAEDGENGLTPIFEVRDGDWYISYDNGQTWNFYGQATGDKGDKGEQGDSVFSGIEYNDQYITLTLVGGKVLQIPTWASHLLLVDEISRINNNISALQKAVEALQKNDYVTKVTPIEDQDGKVIGYVLSFAFTGDVSIYHGIDGQDGHSPVVGAKMDTDGNWYWTIDDQWLLDKDGNKIRTTGDDGLTPKLEIREGDWYISYDDGATWNYYGQATGDKGEQGDKGDQGDAIFAKDGIDVSNPDYVTLTLVDGTKIKIPTWAYVEALAKRVEELNENIKSLQTIVSGLQQNDYVTSITPLIDPQTNEQIGYTLHFAYSGNVDIYHGEDGKDGEDGEDGEDGLTPTVTISEDGYWVINGEKLTVKALAVDGQNGITPKFKIEEGRWFVSYDNGASWSEAGQATGDQGATGPQGPQGPQGPAGEGGVAGDAFFKSVTEEYATDADGKVITNAIGKPVVAYIVITLNDNDDDDSNNPVYKIPTDYVIGDLQKQIDAITNDIKSIQVVINAVQNSEYIKSCTPVYDGLVLIGYEIVFAKFTVEDGEQTRKVTIYNGTDGVNGTLVGAEFDEATKTWYWTLDGKPLKDADGKLVPVQGKDGKDGVTPKMQINATTNFWEVSYDGGSTWQSTGVKATGPKGEDGSDGSAGANGDPYFSEVKVEGDYVVFYLQNGTTISVPTAQAFETLAKKVASLEETSKSLSSLLGVLDGMKFVKSCERFENETGSGYHFVLVTLNASTMATTEEDCYVYDGKNGENGTDGKTPVVGLRQDTATGDWYWTVDGEDILVDGKPVKANGADGADGQPGAAGPVPSFRIDAEGYLWVKIGDAAEQNLGKVVGAAGSTGASGSDASIVVEEKKDEQGNPTGEVIITFMKDNQATGQISVPSWSAFQKLQGVVSALNEDVKALKGVVDAISTRQYIKSYAPTADGYKITLSDGPDADTEDDVIYINHGKNGEDGTNGTTPEVSVKADDSGVLYWTVNGEWLLDDQDNKVPATGPKGEDGTPGTDGTPGADGVNGKTPTFKVGTCEVDGTSYANCWLVSYDEGATWNPVLGADGKPCIAKGETGTSGDSFFAGVDFETVKNADGKDVVAYIILTLRDNTQYKIPTEYTFKVLEERVSVLESQFSALQTIVNAINKQEYVKKVVGVYDGLKLTGYKITFVTYSVGADGTLQETEVERTISYTATADIPVIGAEQDETTGIWYWTIDGERIKDKDGKDVPLQGPQGEPGKTPQITIGDNGNWFINGVDTGMPSQGQQGPQGPQGDSFFKEVVYVAADEETVTNVNEAYYIKFIFVNGDSICVPTASAFKSLIDAVTRLDKTVDDLSALVDTQKTALESLSGTVEDFINGLENKKFVGIPEYDEKTQTWTFPVVNGKGEAIEGKSISIVQGNVVTIGTKEGSDQLYWVIDGQVTDYPVTGNNGADGKTPNFRVNTEEGTLEYTFDDPSSSDAVWTSLGKVVGPQGPPGNPGQPGTAASTNVVFTNDPEPAEGGIKFITDPNEKQNALWVGIQYGDNTSDIIWMPTYKNFQALQQAMETLKTNVNSLSELVHAQTYIVSCEELADKSGYVLTTKSYDATQNAWVTSSVTIKHGTDGIDGENGADAPAVGVKQDTDGNWYWTIGTGENNWLLDAAGNKVRANGIDGEDGKDGKTPVFAIKDGNLYYTYDGEDASADKWILLGDVTGEDGADALTKVEGETDANGQYTGKVTITLSNGTVLEIPSWNAYQTLLAQVADLNTNVNSLSELVHAQTYIVSCEELADKSGYVLTTKSYDATQNAWVTSSVTIKHGTDGADGEDGADAPTVGVKQDTDGNWYWTIGTGENNWLLDAAGNKVRANGIDGEDGKDGKTPVFAIKDGNLYYTYDGEDASADKWILLGDVTGEDGADALTKVEGETDANGQYTGKVTITLSNGTVLEIPSWNAYQTLLAQVADLNTNVNSLSELVHAQTYIVSCEELADKSGYVLTTKSYDATQNAWVTSSVTIKHGTDGADGEDGADAPAVGVKQDTDGNWYWTIGTGENNWLLDAAGNKVRANGIDGEDGKDGKTPVFAIKDGNLYYTYDGEDASADKWILLGDVTGEDGADALTKVEGETDANGQYTGKVTITLSNGTVLEIPSWNAYQTLLAQVADLNTNVNSLSELVHAQTYIVSCEELADKSGYVLTTKSYDATQNAWVTSSVTIKHGTDGADGEDGADAPAVGVKQDTDGNWYWTIGTGENNWLLDAAGNKVRANGIDGEDGKDGKTPVFAIKDGNLYYTYDGEDASADKWILLGDVTGEDGADALTKVEGETDANGQYTGKVTITLSNGTVLEIPSWNAYQTLLAQVADLNTNVNSLSELVHAQTYIVSCEELADKSGYVLTTKSYDATQNAWVTSSVTIKHGTDGADGEDGADAPTVGVKQDTDGNWYWTIGTGENNWLLDAAGNKVRANGIDGEDGKDGKTPVFAIKDGNLYYTYDGEDASADKWILLGDVTGEDGADALTKVEGETDANGQYTGKVTITLSNGTVLEIPSWNAYEVLNEKVLGIESTISGLQTLITDMTFVTGITEKKVDGKVVGIEYTTATIENGQIKHDTTPKTITLDGVVIPNGTEGFKYFNGTEYVSLSWSDKLSFRNDGNKIQVSIDGGETWMDIVHKDNYGSYVEHKTDNGVVTSYTISFPGKESINVPAYLKEPIVMFYKDNNGVKGDLINENDILTGISGSGATVHFEIYGSFGSVPSIFATCEGNWTSTLTKPTTVSTSTDGTKYVTGSVKVKPTTAYVGDSTEGKLTLYVPYYGVTGMGQIELSAQGVSDVVIKSMQILNREAENPEVASVSFRLEGEDAPPSSDQLPLVFDYQYDLSKEAEADVQNGVAMGKGFSRTTSTTGWMKPGELTYKDGLFTQTIEMSNNVDSERSRAGAVVVFSPSGREVTRFVINQEPMASNGDGEAVPEDQHPIKKLIPDNDMQSANCYIITEPGRYELPAYKGAQKDLKNAERLFGTPATVWNDSENTITYYQGDSGDDKIIVEVNLGQNNLQKGNAVIAIKDGNKTLWSWHLWFSPPYTILGTNIGEVSSQKMPAGTTSMMDRNLGADVSVLETITPGAITGLYYKYGYRTPFYNGECDGAESVTDNLTWKYNQTYQVTENGTTETKTNKKHSMDPCPAGYRVPEASVWTSQGSDGGLVKAYLYWNNSSNYIYYPYSEYIESSGKVHVGEKDALSDYKYTSQTNIPIWVIYKTVTYNLRIRYKEKYSISSGVLWSADKATYYSTRYSQIHDEKILEYKEANESWDEAKTSNLEDVKKIPLLGDALNKAANALIKGIAISDLSNLTNDESISKYNGAQIRCVKE